jgi:hypothetical protein
MRIEPASVCQDVRVRQKFWKVTDDGRHDEPQHDENRGKNQKPAISLETARLIQDGITEYRHYDATNNAIT